MKPLFIIAILTSLITVHGAGQEFKISNSSGSKHIGRSDLVEITVEAADKKENECCTYQTIHGNIESVNKDSILVRADILMLSRDFEKGRTDFKDDWNWYNRLNSIAKSDISYLTRHKSKKHKKLKNSLTIGGGILLFTGVGTALNTFVVSGQKNRKNLLLSGGAQFGTGLILAISANSKKYRFKNTDDPWKFD
jgi:hypothetical protein